MDAPHTTSVVICAYTEDRWSELVEAVASVRAQSHRAEEIIVVIDRNDALLTRARAELAGVTVVANHQAPGISGARNTGFDHSSGAVIAFLDDDAIAEPDWLAKLLAPYSDPGILGVGGHVVPLWRYGQPAWLPVEFNWVVGCSYAGLPETQAEVRNPIGACLSTRRTVFEATGGFHHSMGHTAAENGSVVTGTADETEFCIRASQLHPGGRWLYVPEARVHHVVHRSRMTWSFFVGRCRMEGRSKAVLTELADVERGLASERRYVRSVLPRAVLRELRLGLGGDGAALQRGGAIVAGLAITAAAYLRGRIAIAWRRELPSTG
jgi:glycosyltransferase involved in cell wall biosynthesis